MNFTRNEIVLRNCALFLLFAAVPLFALQHKTTEGEGHASTHNESHSQGHTSGGHTSSDHTSSSHNSMGGSHSNPAGGSHNSFGGTHDTASSHSSVAGHSTTAMSHGSTLPGRQLSLRGGGNASIRPNGQIRSINQNGMRIQHNLSGGRTIVTSHNGARVVSYGAHAGYVQRPYMTRGGVSYYSRTYYSHGVYSSVVYRGYFYGGFHYYGYYHPFWFHPAFYMWAWNPWPAPVYWGWGWGGAPWYGYYGSYWHPYPVYPSAAFWLTDYLISENLQAAYAAQAAANSPVADTPPPSDASSNPGPASAPAEDSQVELSPEVKQAIAEEVKAQIAAAQSQSTQDGSSTGDSSGANQQPAPTASTNQVPPALDPAQRTFIVSAELAVAGSDGQECSLTQGDVITRLTDTPDQDRKVQASVASSKKTDCAAGKTVAVKVDDLQEMQNHFQQQLDEGMKALAAKQGSGGLPNSPDPSTVASGVPAPPPDKTAGTTIDNQDAAADKTEADVKQQASSSGGGTQ